MRFVPSKLADARGWFARILAACAAWGTVSCLDDSPFADSKRPNSGNLLEDSFAPGTSTTSETSATVVTPSGIQPAPSSTPTNTASSPDTSDTPPTMCGNGQLEAEEECDDGALNSNETPNACRRDCVIAYCGDGVTDDGEECDGSQDCTFDCHTVQCGNGNVEEGEECDPPAAGTCTDRCRRIFCGNGVIDDGESCEPPSAGRCSADCRVGTCGDQIVDTGEDCDPPSAGTCDATCHAIACGDGVVSQGEGCDPPGTATCDSACRDVGCGNGVTDGIEECEPPGLGTCDASCRTIECGNGRIDADEECDPPANGSCDASCRTIVCGNSRIDSGETCDPPRAGTCNAACQTIECGDGRVDPGEECEPQGSNDAACSLQCTATSTGALVLYTFDSSIDPWVFYAASPTDLQGGTRLSYDGQNGDVSPGVLKVEAPFTGGNQKVEFQVTLGQGLDLRGRVLRARVRLGSGLSSDQSNPGGIKFFAKAGANFGYASGAWTYLDGNGWMDVTLVGDAPILVPNEFDASDVRQIGFELRTFTETTQVSKAAVYIDSVTY